MSTLRKFSYQCVFIFGALLSTLSFAEAIFDGSMGSNSVDTIRSGNFTITENDGTVRGNNLFHSFSTFNVATGESASFTHTSNQINNIITRVTGSGTTEINGRLSSDASLWLLNPNGIIFNEDASLNITGSFYASTADYLRFDRDERFYSRLDENTILAIADPDAFGFLDNETGKIAVNNSILAMNDKNNVSLIGGEIVIENSLVYTQSGRITLAGIDSAGEITGLKAIPHIDESSVDEASVRANIDIVNSDIITQSELSGDIYILGGQLVVEQDSLIAAANSGGTERLQEDRRLSLAVESLQLQENSIILTQSDNSVKGNDIHVSARDITILDNSFIKTTTFGEGQGGGIAIDSDKIRLDGETSDFAMGILAESEASGVSGDIAITADDIDISHDALISTAVFGSGNGGVIDIHTSRLAIDGELSGFATGVLAESYSAGTSGDIQIAADQISVIDGGTIANTPWDAGNGGDITIAAAQIDTRNGGTISVSTTDKYASGDGGQMDLYIDDLTIDRQNGGFTGLSANTLNAGNGGNINLFAQRINILNGGQIAASTAGIGAGGQVGLDVDHLSIDGQASTFFTGISAQTQGHGDGGNIDIDARHVEILSGGTISATTTGGAGGDIHLRTDDLRIDSQGIEFFTGIGIQTQGSGAGGNLVISSQQLEIVNGGSISGSAFSSGAGGQIQIQTDYLLLDGNGAIGERFTGIAIQTHGSGAAGSMEITAGEVDIVNGSSLSAITYAPGAGGNIGLHAEKLTIDRQAAAHFTGISASTTESGGRGGNIDLHVEQLSIDGKGVSNAGIASQTYNESIAGDITIQANSVSIFDGGGISADATESSGNGGAIQLMVSDTLSLEGGATVSSDTTGSGNAGSISIVASTLLQNASLISSFSQGDGGAGSITINASDIVLRNASSISTEVIDGQNLNQPSSIQLTGNHLLLDKDSSIDTSASGSAGAGSITIDMNETLRLFGNSAIATESIYGGGGQITLLTHTLMHLKNSDITTSVSDGSGNGGNIFIDPVFMIMESSTVAANAAAGNGGDITLIADHIIKSPNSFFQASSDLGINGTIEISASEFDSAKITELSAPLLNASVFLQRQCHRNSRHSSFIVDGQAQGVVPTEGYQSRAIPVRISADSADLLESDDASGPLVYNDDKSQMKNCWF